MGLVHTNSPLAPQTAFPGIQEKTEPGTFVSTPPSPGTHSLPYTPTRDTALLCTGESNPPCMCTTANPHSTCYPLSSHGICLNTCFSETGVREPMSAKPTRGKGHCSLWEGNHSPLRGLENHDKPGAHLHTRSSLLTSQKGQGVIHLPRPRLPRPCQGSGLGSHPCIQE